MRHIVRAANIIGSKVACLKPFVHAPRYIQVQATHAVPRRISASHFALEMPHLPGDLENFAPIRVMP